MNSLRYILFIILLTCHFSLVKSHPVVNKNDEFDEIVNEAKKKLSDSEYIKLTNELKNKNKDFTKATFGTAFTPPNHEILTNQSLGKVDEHEFSYSDKWNLIHGVTWNDDPNNYLERKNSYRSLNVPATWSVAFKIAELRTLIKSTFEKDELLARSHFGDLQFLHAMSYKGNTSPIETKRKILEWCEYAYKVSIEEISLNALVNDFFTTKLFDANVTGKILFKINENQKLFALGTILHLIQDSYSDAHVERMNNEGSGDDKHIISFLVYPMQDKDKHKHADDQKSYFKNRGWGISKLHGTKIIEFATKKSSWIDKVKPYLDTFVFPIAKNESRASYAGEMFLP